MTIAAFKLEILYKGDPLRLKTWLGVIENNINKKSLWFRRIK